MSPTLVTVIGLALAGFCVLIAARPVWFRNWRVHHRSADGDYHGSSRLGDSSPGSVSAFYGVLALVFVVVTFVLRGFIADDARCDRARAVHEAGSDQASWQAAAEADGMELTSERGSTSSGESSWTTYTLTDRGRFAGQWVAGASFGDRFSCQPD